MKTYFQKLVESGAVQMAIQPPTALDQLEAKIGALQRASIIGVSKDSVAETVDIGFDLAKAACLKLVRQQAGKDD